MGAVGEVNLSPTVLLSDVVPLMTWTNPGVAAQKSSLVKVLELVLAEVKFFCVLCIILELAR